MGQFTAYRERILIHNLMTKAWIHVFSHPDSIDRYFTNVVYDMYDAIEYDHLVFPNKFPSGDYFFVYDASDNNVACLIQPTPNSADTPNAYMTDEEVVDTMVYDMM